MTTSLILLGEAEAARIRSVVADARAPATRRAYAADLRTWAAWCESKGVVTVPATPTALLLYLDELVQRGRKLSTIQRAVVAIELAHAAGGGATALTSDLVVREYLKGLRRRLRRQPRQQAPPLMLEDLKQLVVGLPATRQGLRDRAMLLVGWWGALRRSEVVGLDVDDVRVEARGVVLRIRSSKTDQEAQGDTLGLPRRSDELCPASALRAWLTVREAAVDDEGGAETALFVAQGNRGRGKRLKPQAVERVLSAVAADGFTPHSLRAGFATSAARAGKPAHSIRRQTRHASIAMLERYIREGEVFVANPGDGL